MRNSVKILCPLFFSFFVACTNNGNSSDLAGNTTEIENALAVKLYDGNIPAARVAYKVLPSWFVADTLAEATNEAYTYTGTTDEEGWVHIENHQSGSFIIQFIKGDSSIVLQYNLDNATPTVTIDSAALNATGSIKGWVTLPKTSSYAWVYLKGIDRVEKTDSTGKFVFRDIPSGTLSLRAWAPKTDEIIGTADVEIPAKDTIDLKHVEAPNEIVIQKSQKVNPQNLISSWMRPLAAPYVLVLRLDSTFNFSETADDGSDIHLLNAKGEPLPIEIDSWDKGIQSGTINVRINDLADTASLWTLQWGDIYEQPQKQVDVWDSLGDSLTWVLNSVKIFDFEDSLTYKNDLPDPLEKKYWYIRANEGATLLDSSDNDAKKAVVASDGGAFGKKVLHVQYKATSPEYVVIGTQIADVPHDLSRLDSVELWVKGDGKMQVILETIIESDTNYKATYETSVQSEWTRVVVQPKDFNTNDPKSYHGWDVTRNRITRFTIFAYDGNDIWIDNVRLYGINRDDLK